WYADWDPWDEGYWWPSAYYGGWDWPWWWRHHHRRRYWAPTYAGYYGYDGWPGYDYAGYDGGWPTYYDYQLPANWGDYTAQPAWNSAYLTDASYTQQLCVQRRYVWDDY